MFIVLVVNLLRMCCEAKRFGRQKKDIIASCAHEMTHSRSAMISFRLVDKSTTMSQNHKKIHSDNLVGVTEELLSSIWLF
jgi:hypothetical protein